MAAMERKSSSDGALAFNARHQGVFLDLMLDEVVLPMLLRVAGQQHKSDLLNSLQAVIEILPDHPGIPPQVADEYERDVRGWQNEVLAIPEWQPASARQREIERQEE